MDPSFLLKGVVLGFSVAAPVGPIGVLCIRRTLQFGRLSGLFSGLGAAAADTVYGIVAAFGMTAISSFLLASQTYLHIIGGGFLIYLGIKTFLSKPSEGGPQATHRSLSGDFLSTFFLTLTNPMTIVSYIAIFAGLGLGGYSSAADAGGLVAGVFLGSALWWLLLSEGVTLFRKKVSYQVMRWVNRIAGTCIALFGIAALGSRL